MDGEKMRNGNEFFLIKLILCVVFIKYILIIATYAAVGYIIYRIYKYIKEKWGDNVEQTN